MNIKSHIAATALMAAAMNSKMFSFHSGGIVSRQFDLGSIMHVRKNNQRNKNQRRLRGMGLR